MKKIYISKKISQTENSTESEEPQAQGDSQVKTNGNGKNGELTRDVIKTNGMNGHVDKSSNQNNSHTELANQGDSHTELANQGPARRRQPSYAERETPIYDLFAMTVREFFYNLLISSFVLFLIVNVNFK